MKRLFSRWRNDPGVIEVGGLVLAVFAAALFLALVTFDAADPSWFNQPGQRPAQNLFGWGGATVGEATLQLFGTAAFLLPVMMLRAAWRRLRGRTAEGRWGQAVSLGVLTIALCSLLDVLYGTIAYGGAQRFPGGGLIGRASASALRALVDRPGALVISATALAAVIVLTTRISLVRSLELAGGWTRRGSVLASAGLRRTIDSARAAWERSRPLPPAAPTETIEPATSAPPAPPVPSPRVLVPRQGAPPPSRSKPEQRRLPLDPPRRADGYSRPPLELLNEPEPQTVESEQELIDRAQVITDKFREFAVNGSVVAIQRGPVVTTFEFKPEAGIKYSKITGMIDDLSLALKAESVRIDRIAGRSTVGIEVPNRRQEVIFPRELFASPQFRESESKLTLALGKDISGQVCCAQLERMPHLLIAGATGAGKSVGLNGMITSILYKATPDDVRFIMIDTKMIELGIYAEIPHLLIPVVTDAKHASTALKWAVREMEQRYRKLAGCGVRNLLQFNELLQREPGRTWNDPKHGEDTPLEPLPYIVIVIDELADLMMISGTDVEESIMRLAQMARAVGIHLVIATQRPSVDVITGTIKANFPSRIAYRVSQRVDSRTIIDQQGAEHLLGRGDMLYLASGSARLRRVHGAYITEPELHRITEHIKGMADPVYDESVLREDSPEGGISGDVERDEMYVRAVQTILQEGKCSITLIQRRLQLGYARAARIVDMMEQEGVVSPGEGSKPREILVGAEFLESIAADEAH